MTKSKISQLCDNLDSQYLIEIEVDETMIDQKTIQACEDMKRVVNSRSESE